MTFTVTFTFLIAAIVLTAVSVLMKLFGRGDAGYWLTVAGVCALISLAGG